MNFKGLIAGAAIGAATLASPAAFAGATGNVGALSEYLFRGLSQNPDDPSIFGGLDYAADSGFYAGLWATNVQWGAGGSEVDVYGGFTTKLSDSIGIDLGAIFYYYPEKDEPEGIYPDADTVEVYAGLLLGPVTLKAFYSPSYFGAKEPASGEESEGDDLSTVYVIASGAFPISDSLNFTASLGFTSASDDAAGGFCPNVAFCEVTDSYLDYSVGLAKTIEGGYTVTMAVVGTDLETPTGEGDDSEKDAPGIVIGLKKTFDL